MDCGDRRLTSVCAIPKVHFGRSPPAYAALGMKVQSGVESTGFV